MPRETHSAVRPSPTLRARRTLSYLACSAIVGQSNPSAHRTPCRTFLQPNISCQANPKVSAAAAAAAAAAVAALAGVAFSKPVLAASPAVDFAAVEQVSRGPGLMPYPLAWSVSLV